MSVNLFLLGMKRVLNIGRTNQRFGVDTANKNQESLALEVSQLWEVDCRDAPTIIYEDGQIVAFFNCDPGEIIMETMDHDSIFAPFVREWIDRKFPR